MRPNAYGLTFKKVMLNQYDTVSSLCVQGSCRHPPRPFLHEEFVSDFHAPLAGDGSAHSGTITAEDAGETQKGRKPNRHHYHQCCGGTWDNGTDRPPRPGSLLRVKTPRLRWCRRSAFCAFSRVLLEALRVQRRLGPEEQQRQRPGFMDNME
ncbi:unnamed protein product [Pleuronectes platessa]|uniref:Uncharacterized protein n=1 Tax=Pleuronectes platessa TaxID=8262 RepID=A0A9N7YZW7_PLEPL|nr:unnamed protein product [Pleuronectes platessa]